MKLIEDNPGKTFSDINHTNVFLGQSPKAIEIKNKNRSSHRGAAETNPTRNHEVVGLVLGFDQWVKDPELL